MKKSTAKLIIDKLKTLYPTAKPALKFSSEYELLVAVMLSAQCTDERVNKVTNKLFKDYNTPYLMANLSQEELSKKILPCGLHNSKSKNILNATKSIINNFNGKVPSTFEELISLNGVGRKTADVVLSVAFNKDAIAVDTHVFRVSNRIGLAKGTTPYSVEMGLMQILDKSVWSKAHHYLIFHGRNICKARNPKCDACVIKNECEFYKKSIKGTKK